MSEPLLHLQDVRVSATSRTLARCDEVQLRAGEALVIVGETGSGKSLLALAMMGVLPPELSLAGSVRVAGIDIARAPQAAHALWGREIALVPQEPWLALDPTMGAFAQVEEVFSLVRGLPRDEARRLTREALASLGLDPDEARLPFALSGGMCQRVALAMSRAAGARLVIADEPTKGLDAALRDDVVRLLCAERDRGAALVVITHDLEVARGVGGRIAVMLESEIVEDGDAESVLSAPRHAYTRRLIAADPSNWPERSPRRGGARVLSGRGLGKAFGENPLFASLDVDLHRGESVAVLGPSGTGKTTLGNTLLGLVALDRGRVERGDGLSALKFQKLYQDPAAAFAPRQTMRGAFDDVIRRHGLRWSDAQQLMERLHLDGTLLDRRPGQISGGELQRFALARVLLLDPAFLFADEPTSRLDPITQRDVMVLLDGLVAERGMAMLLVTHDPVLAGRSSDRQLRLA